MDQPPNNEPSKETVISSPEVDSVTSRKRKASGSPETETQDSDNSSSFGATNSSTSAGKGESSNEITESSSFGATNSSTSAGKGESLNEITENDKMQASSVGANSSTSAAKGESSNEITENDKMQTSTSAAKGESSKQVGPKEPIIFDYIFKKLLTGTDVNDQMNVPLGEAEKHFPRISDVWNSTAVCVYDINREQKIEWELSRNCQEYSFTANWKVYVNNNQLQAGDSVLFYKMVRGQILNRKLPRYAVKIEKAGENTDMGTQHIPFDKLSQGAVLMTDPD